jgi:hypothetical protein
MGEMVLSKPSVYFITAVPSSAIVEMILQSGHGQLDILNNYGSTVGIL